MVKRLHCKYQLFLFIYFITFPSVSYSFQYQQNNDINKVISNIITADKHPYLNNSIFFTYKKTIDELYFFAPQHLLWINKYNRDDTKITAVLQLISNAKHSGLNEEHYNLTSLRTKWLQLISQQQVNYKELALLDTAISINLLHFLTDLHFGRINPQSLKFNFESDKDSTKFVSLILQTIKNNNINTLLDKVEPDVPAYHKLKKALLTYRKKLNNKNHSTLKYISLLRPGDVSTQTIAIRQQLHLLGLQTNKINSANSLYDEALVNIIKRFQLHHGLRSDGIIGKKTIKALNIPVSDRIQQIELALERFRWLPEIKPGPQVIVNIPAFQLWAYDTNKKNELQALNMKVIVGESVIKKQSPVFTADMLYLEFSPYWNIPKSITVEEIIPKLLENPLYLEQQDMELVTGFHNNEFALPYTVDSIMQLQDGSLKLRQRPGKKNALGKVKFIFPNNFNVYLHDTPTQQLFGKSKRDFSHGCIRVEKPTELAYFLLKSKIGWTQHRIANAMHLHQPKKVRLSQTVPVIVFYSTAMVVQDKLFFYDDIYGLDSKLKQALIKHQNTKYKIPLS